MAHDPALIAEARPWLGKSASDLRMAAHALVADPPLLDASVFHSQQATEKALKGFLVWHGIPFRKTHDLTEAGVQCAAIAPDLESLFRRAAPLTEYAWKYRYPGAPADPTRQEADEALAIARDVHAAILARLPHDVHP